MTVSTYWKLTPVRGMYTAPTSPIPSPTVAEWTEQFAEKSEVLMKCTSSPRLFNGDGKRGKKTRSEDLKRMGGEGTEARSKGEKVGVREGEKHHEIE